MFDRDIRVTVLGNTGVGKTTLINRMIGTDVKKIVSKKTLEINIEEKKIKLKSSEDYPWYSPEAHRKYRIIAIDNPGDYKLRRKWREAMRKFKTDGMLFLLDPDQSVEVQRVAMEDSYNYFLDSLDLKPEKADKKAADTKYIFHFVVNKVDLFSSEDPNEFKMSPKIKEQAVDFLAHFAPTMDEFKTTFPLSKFGISYLSTLYSPYKSLDKLFEILKVFLYQT
ncbi:MAG: GTPase domain-containing protein [Candidatus Heimdallarchaeota archaeon]|nr:MAG: GTPase domain-containing protein [Candidatus Heimdallarchaeota archaeon]